MDTLSRSRDALTVVIVEKPSTGRAIAAALRKHPDALDVNQTFIVHGFRHFEVPFQFPTATHWRNFPVIVDPVYKVGSESSDFHMAYRLPAAGEKPIYLPDAEARALFLAAPEIRLVQACDPDATGSWFFARSCHSLLDANGFLSAFDLETLTLDSASVDRAVKVMLAGKSNVHRESQYNGKLLQRRFEFNWWVNAHALLRPLLKLAGLASEHTLSKYELQAACFFAGAGDFSAGEALRALYDWKGSGKYQSGPIGSLTSHSRMLQNLVRTGLLLELGNGQMRVGTAGRSFLNALPKDCQDPDLPFRLARWCEAPESSKAKADAYLHHWFGKVKNTIPRSKERGPRKPKALAENS